MAPKKPATPAAKDVVLVDVTVLSHLDHDGEAYEVGAGLAMDLEMAKPLRDLGVVDFDDPTPVTEQPAAPAA